MGIEPDNRNDGETGATTEMSKPRIFRFARCLAIGTGWVVLGVVLLSILAVVGVVGYIKIAKPFPENPKPKTVQEFAKQSHDPCVVESARAIAKSGLPYPHRELTPDRNSPGRSIVRSVDVWVGNTRFEIPSEYVGPKLERDVHPLRYGKLQGTSPAFFPKGPEGPNRGGMRALVEVSLGCAMNAKYLSSWGHGASSTEEAIQIAQASYESQAKVMKDKNFWPKVDVRLSRREDLGLIELLMDSGRVENGFRRWEAYYWPIKGELKNVDGSVSSIRCDTRNDPTDSSNYSFATSNCWANLRLIPQGGAQIRMYITQVADMPSVFEQVKNLLIESKRETIGD